MALGGPAHINEGWVYFFKI